LSEFNWDQPHPDFAEKQKALEIAEMFLRVAKLELQAICAHKFAPSIHGSPCSVCSFPEWEVMDRKYLLQTASSLRTKLDVLNTGDPNFRGGPDDL
jgi:hypothetical protein